MKKSSTGPWAFEFTPPSSGPPDATYLSKVWDADLLIWLVTGVTTGPVRDEIAEAVAAGRPILAVRLPGPPPDELANEVFDDVRSLIKYAEDTTPEDLRELFTLAFSDEIIRAFRGTPSLSRLALLEQLGQPSLERMADQPWARRGHSVAAPCSASATRSARSTMARSTKSNRGRGAVCWRYGCTMTA
jgi:hypothetical protein